MYMRYLLLIVIVALGIQTASAQDVYTSSGRPQYAKKKENKKKGYDPSKLILGGGLVASFGSGYADLGVSPIIGYRFTDRFSAGVGLGYEYLKNTIELYDQYSGAYNPYNTSASIISPSVWSRCFVYRNVFLTGVFEYDVMFLNTADYDNSGNIYTEKSTLNVPCLLLGGGLRQPLGGRVSVVAELLYDVLQQPNSPYLGQPVIRFGIVAGL